MVQDILQQVQRFYDEAGEHFSRTRQKKYASGSANWPVTDRYLANLSKGQRVLDIGCGNGKLITGLPSGVEYVGTDFSRTLLSEAAKWHPEGKFVYGDVTTPSHWENLGEYDAIFAVAVLHHIPTTGKQLFVLNQARKHLKKNGFLFLTVWNLWQERFLQYHLDGYAEIPYNKDWVRYCVTFDVQSLANLLTEAGWNISEIFYADRAGEKADVVTGENLVVIAK